MTSRLRRSRLVVFTLLALVTLALKTLVEWRQRRVAAERADAEDSLERIAA